MKRKKAMKRNCGYIIAAAMAVLFITIGINPLEASAETTGPQGSMSIFSILTPLAATIGLILAGIFSLVRYIKNKRK